MSKIKLQDGGTYRDREGKTWVVKRRPGGSSHRYPFTDIDERQVWSENGIWGMNPGRLCDLVEEVQPSELEPTRKDYPVTTGCLHYFPDALLAVARCSSIGNDQHNPGEPLHWAKNKSDDHLNCLGRHLLEAGKLDDDGILHDVKVAWRALANLQTVIDQGTEVFK